MQAASEFERDPHLPEHNRRETEALESHGRVLGLPPSVVVALLSVRRVAHVFCHDGGSFHDVGQFLDHRDFSALSRVSATLQDSLRKAIRARNQKLPPNKRLTQLESPGHFEVEDTVRQLLRREGRIPLLGSPDVIAVGGAGDDGLSTDTVLSLDLYTMNFTTLAPLKVARQHHASALINGKRILCVAGEDINGVDLNTVESLDLMTGEWGQEQPLNTARSRHGVTELDGKLYVVGGHNGTSRIQSVEWFDLVTGRWSASPVSLLEARCEHGTASWRGNLIVVGGSTESSDLTGSVECFNPVTGERTAVAPLNQPRDSPALVVLENKLFVLGGSEVGSDGYEVVDIGTVESLDLENPMGPWVTEAPMNTNTGRQGVVVRNGKILVVGCQWNGTDSEGEDLDPTVVEAFDPHTGRWKVMASTPDWVEPAWPTFSFL